MCGTAICHCRLILTIIVVSLISKINVSGQFLSVSFEDGVEDHSGRIDLTRLTLTFSQQTGEYEVLLESTSSARFQGEFLVGVNLFNGDLGTSALDPSYFHSNAEVLWQDCPSPFYRLSGIDPRLIQWSAGDRIAAGGPEPLGLPDGFTVFSSGLASTTDVTQGDDVVGAGVFRVLETVGEFPEPESPPSATEDFFELEEDSAEQLFDVLKNDCSASILAEKLAIAQIIEVSILGQIKVVDDRIAYAPPMDFFGVERLEYLVTDPFGNIDVGSVVITVSPVNDPPVALDDQFEISGRVPRHVVDVLANDSSGPDPDESLTVLSFQSDPKLGRVTLEDGLLVIEPTGEFHGETTIAYVLSDGNGGQASAVASIRVNSPNRNPTALDDSVSAFEETVLLIDVLANDSSAPDEGELLSLLSVGESLEGASVSILDGKLSYLAPKDFFGVDVFSYTISDDRGGVSQASVRVTVSNVNDPPFARDDFFNIGESPLPQVIRPLLNDGFSPDPPESLVLSDVRYSGSSASLLIVENEVLVVAATGFMGVFQFQYGIDDGNGGQDTGVVTVSVRDLNNPPIATADIIGIEDNGQVALINVLENDSSEPDRDEVLRIISVVGDGVPGSTLSHDGELVTFLPKEGFSTGWFRYSISDGNGGRDSALVVVRAVNVIEQPTANADFFTLLEDQVTVLDVLKNDVVNAALTDSLEITITTAPTFGMAAVASDGSIEYRPNQDFYGRDSFVYMIVYPNGRNSSVRVVLDVKNVNDVPQAVDDRYVLLEDSAATILDVLMNDTSDPDPGEKLFVTTTTPTINAGNVTIAAGILFYQPPKDFFGTDSFSYSIRDSGGERSEARVEVAVAAVNDPPLAASDDVVIDSDTEFVVVDVLANDSFAPDSGEMLHVFSVDQGDSGGAVWIAENKVIYRPPATAIVMDRFSYSVSDGNGGASEAEVTVTIQAFDKPPVGRPDKFEIAEDSVDVRLDVLANDLAGSVSGAVMTVSAVESFGEQGRLVIEPDGLVFSPIPNFVGMLTFSYRIEEGGFESDLVPVTINVLSVNDPPVATDDRFLFENPGDSVFIDVLANDSTGVDPNETLAVVSASAGSAGGGVILEAGRLRYEPDPSFEGVERFTYTISDGNGGQGSAIVTVEVVRRDTIPPVVVCRDAEVMLPESGELELDVSLFDAGSHDESGGVALSVVPDRFGPGDVGDQEVLLRGVDDAGNSSTCIAHVKVITLSRLSVDVVQPGHRSVYQVSENYDFNATDVPVEVSVVGELESIEIIGDGRTLVRLSVPDGVNSMTWVWEEVRWGDHEISAVGFGVEGGQVTSIQSRFSVSELASHVAMVIPAAFADDEQTLIAEYLFEMGVNLEIFAEPLPSDFRDQAWDMVIWNGLENAQVTSESVAVFETLAQRRVGLYFIGTGLLNVDGLNGSSRDAWEQLVLMEDARRAPADGLVEFFPEGDERLLKGRFGTFQPFTLTSTKGGQLVVSGASPLIQLEGMDLVASHEFERDSLGEGGRRVVQLFPLDPPKADFPLKTLFQNAVCWLLPDCFDCVNSDLPPVIQGQIPDPFVGQVFSVDLRLVNNGACEVSGAKVGVAGGGLEVTQLLIDGDSVPVSLENGNWTGPIGRVGKGSESAVSVRWLLKVTDSSVAKLRFETQSNNTAAAIVEVPIEVLQVSIESILEGGVVLMISGKEDQVFEIDFTSDLNQPILWERLLPPLPLDAEGKARVELESNLSGRFFRVTMKGP